MKGGNRSLPKPPQKLEEMTQSHRFECANTSKLRKIKDLENETRCHSSRSHTRDAKEKQDTSRTRSVSPTLYKSPLSVNLPLKKFYKIYSKIVVQLETVKNLSEVKKNETENLIDLRRQLQRADEFSIRFSRNNLYETKRIIHEMKKLIVPYPFDTLSPDDCKLLCKKIILGYQAASQALQTYINYVKNPSNLEVPEKINELIILIADLFLCCEHLSLPPDEVYIQNDAVKICNELMALLNSKVNVTEYLDKKQEELTKKKLKAVEGDMNVKRYSMYESQLLNSKSKSEAPRKAAGRGTGLLGLKANKMKKADERKARITHEIYTQKMNMRPGKEFGSKAVKFETPTGGTNERGETGTEKRFLKRPRFTPREVRSQDDDIETMIQTIGDDEVPTSRGTRNAWREDEDNLDKNNFKELLLEAIEELKKPEKKEQRSTLKKLLNSIQNCSKSQHATPRPSKVKVFHFVSKDLEEEEEGTEVRSDDPRETHPHEGEAVDLMALHEKQKAKDEILSRERSLRMWFKPLKPKKVVDGQGEVIPRGKIKLKIPRDSIVRINNYKKSFKEYKKNNIMYKKSTTNKPWELLEKVSDRVIADMLEEIARDFQNDAILRRLYLNELLEIVN